LNKLFLIKIKDNNLVTKKNFFFKKRDINSTKKETFKLFKLFNKKREKAKNF
jgi:hypothetical protein